MAETKLKTQAIDTNLRDGWINPQETWTYESATEITVPSGAVSKFAKGDKIKLTQTTVKYFYIVGVADTVLTITGGSDYTLVDATISDNYYSHASSPIGFPQSFNYTLALTASAGTAPSLGNATVVSTFSIRGLYVKVDVIITFGSTSSYGDGGYFKFSVPVTQASSSSDKVVGICNLYDSGTTRNSAHVIAISTADVNLRVHGGNTDVRYNTPWTWTTADIISLSYEYLI